MYNLVLRQSYTHQWTGFPSENFRKKKIYTKFKNELLSIPEHSKWFHIKNRKQISHTILFLFFILISSNRTAITVNVSKTQLIPDSYQSLNNFEQLLYDNCYSLISKQTAHGSEVRDSNKAVVEPVYCTEWCGQSLEHTPNTHNQTSIIWILYIPYLIYSAVLYHIMRI